MARPSVCIPYRAPNGLSYQLYLSRPEREKPYAYRLQVEADPEASTRLGHGIRTLDPAELRRDASTADRIGEYLFAGTRGPGGTPHFAWESEDDVEAQVGLTRFGIETSVRARITLKRKLELRSNLPGGHDYRLPRLRGGRGVVWKVD